MTALNIGAGKSVMMLGDKVKSMDEIIAEVAEFICSCQCAQNELSQTEKRFAVLQIKQTLNKSIYVVAFFSYSKLQNFEISQ